MNFSSDQLLTLLLVNGYPILFGVVLAGAIGLPLPLSALLMAAGGLAAEGEFDLPWVVGIVLSAAVLGDCVSFGLARWAGEAIIHRHGKRVGLNAAKLTAARERTAGRTGLAIFLTRWWLTPLALPMNVVAGVMEYPRVTFAGLSLAGEILWTSGYVGIGYIFGESWSAISDIVSDSSGLLMGVGFILVAGVTARVVWSRRARAGKEGAEAD